MIQIPESFKGTFEGCSTWEGHAPMFRTIIDRINPKDILEIGFFRGSSSFMWLYMSEAKLTTFDPCKDTEFPLNPRKFDGAPENADKLKELFPDRFTFYKEDSRWAYNLVKDNKYDLIFIDGSHLAPFVRSDLNLSIKLKIPYILLDDYNDEVERVYLSEFQNNFDTLEVFDTSRLDTGVMNRACFAKLKLI